MKTILGMLLAMGVHRLPFITDYWSENPLLGSPGIIKCMPRDCFKAILRYLHPNDNSQMPARSNPNFNMLYKVRPLINTIQSNPQMVYYPHQQVTVDEAMVLFRGCLWQPLYCFHFDFRYVTLVRYIYIYNMCSYA